MKTVPHLKRGEDRFFHPHPLHITFSLVAGFVLAVLIVFVLATPAH